MQILGSLRRLPLISLQNHIRNYVKKPKTAVMSNRLTVQQEMLHYVNPFARINIKSDIFVHVEPVDVHVYSNGDAFIAQLLGEANYNCNAKLEVSISADDKVVNVLVQKLKEPAGRYKCHLKIPLRAEACIDGGGKVMVQGIQSECLEVKAQGGITTKNVRATNISLFSEHGNIVCQGTLLAKIAHIETHNGHVTLDKLQGDILKCSTNTGSISTDCCYVESSQFETSTGSMELKNVHKTSQVRVHQAADLKMTGVHGNLSVETKGGSLSLQLSELTGRSQIVAQNLANEAIINISEEIEQNIHIDIKAGQINLSEELEHMANGLSENKSQFQLSQSKEHQLVVSSTGGAGVRLGKQSWTDIMRQTINMNEKS